MRKLKKLAALLCLVGILVSMVVPTALAVDFVSGWTIKIQKIDVVDRLETEKIVENYDGSTSTEIFTDEPAEGYCFAVVTIGLEKQSVDALGFPVNEIQLNVSGEGAFVCRTSNNFLKNHNYDIFASTSLLVTDVGALCFEIPERYLVDNGDGWYVSYRDLESAPYMADAAQKVPYVPNDVDAQEQY